MEHTKQWLRYIDAWHVRDATLNLPGMTVRNSAQDDLGTVDGLIVDAGSGRPYYIVVKAGGWFTSKHFLVPVGQLHLTPDRDALLVLLSKEQIGRFPGFDRSTFQALSEDEVARLNADMLAACEPDTFDRGADSISSRPSYQVPAWWDEYASPRARPKASSPDGPHFDGRAQPGDVIGIETDGERTGVGDTKEDEDERRQRALDAAARQ